MKLTQLKQKLDYLNSLLDSVPQSRLTKSEAYGLLIDIYKLEVEIEKLEANPNITPLNSGCKKFYWVEFSARIAQIRGDNFLPVTYVNFPDQAKASSFCDWLQKTYQIDCQPRKAKRFTDGWECKIKNIPQKLLSSLITKDTQKPVSYHLSSHCSSKQVPWVEFYSPTKGTQKVEPTRTIKLGRYRRTMWELSHVGYYGDSEGRYFYIATNASGHLELHYCDDFGVAV